MSAIIKIIFYGIYWQTGWKAGAQSQKAVSYTHLDVYKRQHWTFITSWKYWKTRTSEEDGQIISREMIEQSIDDGEAYRIVDVYKRQYL